MRVVILPDMQAVSLRAADYICELINSYPDAVLGLATGSTPLGTYQELIRRYFQQQVDFSEVVTFNLDEYVGLPRHHEQTYYSFMHQNFFSHVQIDSQRCHLPDGQCADLNTECLRYEALIDDSGGIDLQMLGIGSDGHIGFNEPGSSLASRTRVKGLTERTRQDNSRFFSSIDQVPRLAITMGVGTIMEAEHIMLLATGQRKAAAVRDFIEGPVSSMVPASGLQMHPKVTVLLDPDAASLLQRRDYYQQMEQIQSELEGRSLSKS
ncbi:MAG: glucosamine-6-phosphate deaminase [Pirellulaceae bacterium]|nr:glucosamine-6-phosphate deaminase [Pirellulaceae bacterium]